MSEGSSPPPQNPYQELDNEALHAAARILNQYESGPQREAYLASEFEEAANEAAYRHEWHDSVLKEAHENIKDLRAENTQLESSFNELLHESQYDPLTKLYNRPGFFRALKEEFQQMRREGDKARIHQFVMFDLDDFKQINDTHGHSGGDAVLVSVAKTLNRAGHLAGRFGGEEFMILLKDTTPDEATEILNELNRLMKNTRYVKKNGDVMAIDKPVSASFGFAEIRSWEGIDDAIDFSDAALYQSKSKPGKAAVTQYVPPQIHRRKEDFEEPS